MDSRVLTLGVVAGLAVAGLARRRAAGSADALRPEAWTGFVVGETKEGTPAILLLDLRGLWGIQRPDDLKHHKGAILGFISTDYPHDSMDRPVSTCDDKDGRSPLQVSVAVAQKGWGPLTTDAVALARAYAAGPQERVVGLYFDGKNRLLASRTLHVGAVDQSLIDVREVLLPAVETRAKSLILVHNHPSGVAEPSSADDTTTYRVAQAAKILGYGLLDHLVLGREGSTYSYAEGSKSSLLSPR